MKESAFTTDKLAMLRLEGFVVLARLARRSGVKPAVLKCYFRTRSRPYPELGRNPHVYEPLVRTLRMHADFLEKILDGGNRPIVAGRWRALRAWGLLSWHEVKRATDKGRDPLPLVRHVILIRYLIRDIPDIPLEHEAGIMKRLRDGAPEWFREVRR